MKVINIHQRQIDQPKSVIAALLPTLATKNDSMLATDKWPAMTLDQGLKVGSKGGHGPMGYFVTAYTPNDFLEFRFTKPRGLDGFHRFEIIDIGNNKTEIKHTIDMKASGSGAWAWALAIRWLHDAYIEDAFDKIENQFVAEKKTTSWSVWVKFLRSFLKLIRRKSTSH